MSNSSRKLLRWEKNVGKTSAGSSGQGGAPGEAGEVHTTEGSQRERRERQEKPSWCKELSQWSSIETLEYLLPRDLSSCRCGQNGSLFSSWEGWCWALPYPRSTPLGLAGEPGVSCDAPQPSCREEGWPVLQLGGKKKELMQIKPLPSCLSLCKENTNRSCRTNNYYCFTSS